MNTIINSWINISNAPTWLTKWIIQYNNIDLTNFANWSGYMIQTWNDLSLDNTIIQEYTSKIIDWWTVIDKRYWNRHLNLNLFIQWTSNADLISKIQYLKQELNAPNGKLYITRNGVVYSYEATCTNIVVPSFSVNDDFVENINLNFLLTSPYAIIEEAVNLQTHETANYFATIQNEWNYKAYPKIMLIWTSWCAITDINIEIKKLWDTTGTSIFIAQPINNWDVMIIDYNLKTVTLNGVEQVFDGFLAPLQTGFNVITFSCTWTVALDSNILYNKTFL